MTTPELGRLNQVEPRTVWPSEASDFTPWLSLPDNLMLLGEALGIDLEIESSEQSVGPFRADLVCRESISDRRILIENQIERTDHTHLGQLMTYAAGLDAVTIVWIARRFTEEHRAALDWLNDITDEGFSFFGVEIELWRIGNSAVAPHFKVISKPNEWSRSVKRDAKKAELEELSETRRLYHDYWTAFSEYLGRVPSQIKLNKPPTGMWTVHSIGHGNRFQLSIRIGLRKREAEVLFVIREPARLAKYRWFLERKDDIERELGTGLEWRELPNGKESHVRRVFSDMDPSARAVHERPSRIKSVHSSPSKFQLFSYMHLLRRTVRGCSCTGVDPVRTSYPFVLARRQSTGSPSIAVRRRHMIRSGAGGPFNLRLDGDESTSVTAQSD